MNLSAQIFGKDLFGVTREDLVSYFSVPREETSVLEFKSGQVKINSIFKEVCAFLNTEGGLIVVGSPKERKVVKSGNIQRRICQGKLIPSGFRDKEWIAGLIAANIVPYPAGIRIHEIQSFEGKYFIFEVPQSNNPPHQFLNDGRYYIRMDKEAKPAPHGLVEALFYKRVRAQLRADIRIRPTENSDDNRNLIEIDIRNASSFPTDHVSYLIRVLNIEKIIQNGDSLVKEFSGEDGSFQLHGSSEQTLLDEMMLPIRFELHHRHQPFIISVIAWNKEAGMFKNHGLFDPVNEEYIDHFQTGQLQEKTLRDLRQTLQEIQKHM